MLSTGKEELFRPKPFILTVMESQAKFMWFYILCTMRILSTLLQSLCCEKVRHWRHSKNVVRPSYVGPHHSLTRRLVMSHSLAFGHYVYSESTSCWVPHASSPFLYLKADIFRVLKWEQAERCLARGEWLCLSEMLQVLSVWFHFFFSDHWL